MEDLFGSDLEAHEMHAIRCEMGEPGATAAAFAKGAAAVAGKHKPVSGITATGTHYAAKMSSKQPISGASSRRAAVSVAVDLGSGQSAMRSAGSREDSAEEIDQFVDAFASGKHGSFGATGPGRNADENDHVLCSVDAYMAADPFDGVQPPRLPAGDVALSSMSECFRGVSAGAASSGLAALGTVLSQMGCTVSQSQFRIHAEWSPAQNAHLGGDAKGVRHSGVLSAVGPFRASVQLHRVSPGTVLASGDVASEEDAGKGGLFVAEVTFDRHGNSDNFAAARIVQMAARAALTHAGCPSVEVERMAADAAADAAPAAGPAADWYPSDATKLLLEVRRSAQALVEAPMDSTEAAVEAS